MKNVNRREFMVDGSRILGGAIGCMTLGEGLLFPNEVKAADIIFPESSCGPEKKTERNVLVAYASLCGTTGEVAEAVGRFLCERGASVDVRLIKNVSSVDPYDAFVVGSAVKSASWWPEAIGFVKNNREVLRTKPVAYFLTCLALHENNERSLNVARGYMRPVLESVPEVKPVDLGLFAGVLDYSRLNLVYRMVMKSNMKKKGVPEGDFRNWNEIQKWSEGMCHPILGL